MLLTINNLPSRTRYADVKSLIHSKCGPLEVILDNLVTRNKFKTVTVGVADEADAAILVRKINGLFMDGAQLYVEDPRQSKRQEQPYRAADMTSHPPNDISGQMTYGYQSMNSNDMMQPQAVMPVVPMNENLMTYGMPYGMYVTPSAQNAAFMGYGQQMGQNMSGVQVPIQEQSFNEDLSSSKTFQREQRKDSNNYQPTVKKSRLEISDQYMRSQIPERNSRDHSPRNIRNDDLGRDNYKPGTKFGNTGRQDPRNCKPNREPRAFESKRNDRNDFRNDPYSNRNDHQSSRPEHAAEQNIGISSSASRECYSGSRSDLRQDSRGERTMTGLFDIPSYKNVGFSDQTRSQQNPEFLDRQSLIQEPEYYDHPSLLPDSQFRDSSELIQERKHQGLMPELTYKDKGSSSALQPYTRGYSDSFQDRYNEPDRSNNDFSDSRHQRYSADLNNFGQFNTEPHKTLNVWSEDIHKMSDRKYDNRKRQYSDTPYQSSGSARRQSEWTGDHSSKNFENKLRNTRESKFRESREVRNDWNNPERVPEPRFSNHGESVPSKYSHEFHERKAPLKSEHKSRDNRRGPQNLVKQEPSDKKVNLTHAATRAAAWKILNKKPNDQGPKNRNVSQSKYLGSEQKPHVQESMTTLINKDQTCRGQATAEIARDIVHNLQIQPTETKHILKPLKVSIRSRLELILGEDMVSSKEEVVSTYRKKFPEKNDAAFFDAILKEYEKGETKLVAKTEEKQETSTSTTAVEGNQPKEATIDTKPPPKKNPPAKSITTRIHQKQSKIPRHIVKDQSLMKQRKKQAKLQYLDEDFFKLPETLKTIFNEELEDICKPFHNYECSEDDEVKITNIMKKKIIPVFKKSVKLNVTKRLLNINSNLIVRVYFYGKMPKGDDLKNFLKQYGVECCRRSRAGQYLLATCDTFDNYDKLLSLPQTSIGGCSITVKPLHLTGFKPGLSREQMKKQRTEFIKSQIDNTDQSDVNEDDENLGVSENFDDLEDY